MNFPKKSLLVLVATLLFLSSTALADECEPAKALVVLDKSSSMNNEITGMSKWTIAVNALDAVLDNYENAISFGLSLFPMPSQCSPGQTVVAPALGNKNSIISQLSDPPPAGGNWTPMAESLTAAGDEPFFVGSSSPNYVVLITDGWQWCDPYDSSTRFLPVEAVEQLSIKGITTYVVGFGTGVDAAALNMMAVIAGTARPGCDSTLTDPAAANHCYYAADESADLIEALNDISLSLSQEVCDGKDNDCNGSVDENLTRGCSTTCGEGSEQCVNGNWEGCTAPPVSEEVCDGEDNDCDGTTDPGCECVDGESRDCGSESNEGLCTVGVQECTDGQWGNCEGSVTAENEMCDGLDNDCDGEVDEEDPSQGVLCEPGQRCFQGDCVPVTDGNVNGENGAVASSCACNGGGSPLQGALYLILVFMGLRWVMRKKIVE